MGYRAAPWYGAGVEWKEEGRPNCGMGEPLPRGKTRTKVLRVGARLESEKAIIERARFLAAPCVVFSYRRRFE